MSSCDVAIVGAGAAGLAAASELSRAGRSVVVLEARSRPGGRIWTRSFRGWPIPVELGAEFVHGRKEAILGAANPDMPFVRIPDAHFERSASGWRDLQDVWDRFDALTRRLPSRGPDLSIGEYLRQRGRHLCASDRRLLVDLVEGYDAAPIAEASARALSTAGRPPVSDADRAQFRPVRGYGRLVRKISADIDPSKCRMLFATAVERIEWRKGRVRLHASGGEVRARRAVITLPVGVLSASRGTRGAVAFDPEPPVVAAVRDGLAMGDAVRVVLRFRHAFWRDRVGPSGADLRRVEPAFLHLPGAAFPTWWTSAPVEAPVLTAWAGGPSATALLRLPREQRLRRALADLSGALNVPLRQVSREYREGRSHDWTSDPFSRGAYSYVRVGGAGVAARLRQPIEDTLSFAGEACGRDETGTVAAALESGREAAARILR